MRNLLTINLKSFAPRNGRRIQIGIGGNPIPSLKTLTLQFNMLSNLIPLTLNLLKPDGLPLRRRTCVQLRMMSSIRMASSSEEQLAANLEMGVPESQYKGKDLVAKRELAHDVLTKNMVKKAIHDSSGCIPVRTYEAFNDKEYRIGIILRSGPRCRTLSKCIRMKKRPMLDGERRSWRELYPTEKDMLNEFGVRLYIDETGTPTLLSFGQFGTSYTGKNKTMRERFEKQAKHQALTLADLKIAEFINSMMDVTDETPEIGMEMQDAISAFSDDTKSREEKLNILDKFRKGFSSTANMDMEGISTAFGPLMVTHKSGHRVALVVRRWSFDRVEAIREAERIEKEADKSGGTVPPPQPKPAPGGSGVRSGATYDF